MKKALSVLLVLSLTFLFATYTMAAVHSFDGEKYSTDSFYSIDPNSQAWQAYYHNYDTDPNNCYLLSGEYFLNDQTFANLTTGPASSDDNAPTYTRFDGSYLFNFGLFAGLAYFSDSDNSNNNETIISPGYRFNFDKNSYAALSANYMMSKKYNGDNYNRVENWDLDFRYYLKNAKVIVEVLSNKDEYTDFSFSGAYKINDSIIIGANNFASGEDEEFDAGLTWATKPVIVDFMYGYNDETHYYSLNGLFNIVDNFGIGLNYTQTRLEDDNIDPSYTLILKYTIDKGALKFFYTPKNDSTGVPSEITIAYYTKF